MALTFAIEDMGILPDRMIAALAAGRRRSCPPTDFVPDQIQPASLDLRLGEVAYRVRASFLPGPTARSPSASTTSSCTRFALGDGAVLETGCVYIVPLLESLALPDGYFRRRQSEKLDRAARRLHPRDHRRRPALRPARGRLSRPALCRDLPAHFSGAGARRLAARRRSVSAAAMRCSAPRRCANCTRASGWSMPTTPMWARCRGRRRSVGQSRRQRAAGHRRLPRQAPHRPDRRRAARRLRRARFLGADRRRAPTRASSSTRTSSTSWRRRKRCRCRPTTPPRWCRSIRWSANSACTMPASSIPASAMPAPAASGARAVLEVRSREVPFILEHGQIVGRLVYEKHDRRGPTSSMAPASARTTRRRA